MVPGGTGRWIFEDPFFEDAGCGHCSLPDITAAFDPICVRDDHAAYHWQHAGGCLQDCGTYLPQGGRFCNKAL